VISCKNCNIDIAPESKFCPECGSKIIEKNNVIDFESLIQGLIEKNLELLSGYGDSRDDRGLVEHGVTKIIDGVCSNFYGNTFYQDFNPKTRLGNVYINEEFTNNYLPLIVEFLIKSNDVPSTILPVISSFLWQSTIENNVDLDIELKNQIILNTLQDNLSDNNLSIFYTDFWFQVVIDFYNTTAPNKKDAFLKSLTDLANSAKAGVIDIPQSRESFLDLSNRQELWQNLIVIYQTGLYPQQFTVHDFLGLDGLGDAKNYIQREFPEVLKYEYLAFFYCKPDLEGKDFFLIFTSEGICYFPMKAKHMKGKPSFYPAKEIDKITIGEEIHESHGGFTSSTSHWMLLTIFTKEFQQYARYIPDGNSEQEMNEIRPSRMADLNKISKYYQLEEGESYQSSSGFSLSPSIGVWGPIGGND
jgi:hypothetical protein